MSNAAVFGGGRLAAGTDRGKVTNYSFNVHIACECGTKTELKKNQNLSFNVTKGRHSITAHFHI